MKPVIHSNRYLLSIEQAALGELSEPRLRELRTGYGAGLDRAVAEKRRENLEFCTRKGFERELAAIRSRVLTSSSRTKAASLSKKSQARRATLLFGGFSGVGCALAGAFALLFVPELGRDVQSVATTSAPEQNRAKGAGVKLRLHQKRGDQAFLLQEGAVLSSHDIVQLSYSAKKGQRGVIVSIDGWGAVTTHFPTSEQASLELGAKGFQPLDRAYELDNAPHFERFIFVIADEDKGPEISAQQVRASAKLLARERNLEHMRTQRLNLPKQWHQVSFLVRKDSGEHDI